MSRFADWARTLLKPKPDAPSTAELERMVEDAEKLFPLWQGPAGEVVQRLLAEREQALLEHMVREQLTHEQYTHGRGRIAGYREAVAAISEALKRGAAAQLELERRAAASAQRLQ